MEKTVERVLAQAKEGAKKYAGEELDYLRRFAGIDSPSRDEEGIEQAVQVVEEMLRGIKGIHMERRYAPGYGSHIVARLTPEHPEGKIILNGHTDTVFKRGDAAAHPFHTEGDRAWGLGIVDCKAGIVISIFAVRMMQEADLLPNKEIVFLFNCDEEVGSPSGKQILTEECKGADMAFVFEPSRDGNGVLTQRKGWCDIHLDVIGKQAHTGVNYAEGRSAITEVAYLIQKLYESAVPEQEIHFNAGLVQNDDPQNIVSGHAIAKFSVRVSNKNDLDTVNDILSRIEASEPYIEGVTRTFEVVPHLPMERTDGNVRLYETVRQAGQLLGYDLPEQKSSGGGDSSIFSFNGVPTVDGLGGYMYKIHSVEESMRISSLEEKTCLFGTVLGRMAIEEKGNG